MTDDMIQYLVLERLHVDADMAHDGFAGSINPVRAMSDRDTILPCLRAKPHPSAQMSRRSEQSLPP